jgi:hypothetical protein
MKPWTVLLGLFLGLAEAPLTAVASELQRYPWDNRPAKCGAAPADPACNLESWPDIPETTRRVALLYSTEQFALLERALGELHATKKRFEGGDMPVNGAYWAFRRLMPAPGTQPAERDRVARWRQAVPDSTFATFAEARYLYGYAWAARGGGYGGTVSPESWELYGIRMREAEKVLAGAPKTLKDSPLWHNLMLAIALDTDKVDADARQVFETAVERWPAYYDFYDLMVSRLVPRWGGTWQKVDEFIRHWSSRQEASEGKSLYARLYVLLSLRHSAHPTETMMDWPTMRASFDDLVQRYPNTWYRNRYASYACLTRDKETFNRVMAGLKPEQLNPRAWLSGHSYDACIRWANV